MTRHKEPAAREADLLQGTLDMLILKVVALKLIHDYAIVQRISRFRRIDCRFGRARYIPRCTDSKTAAG
jgi:hypothetical protein